MRRTFLTIERAELLRRLAELDAELAELDDMDCESPTVPEMVVPVWEEDTAWE